MNRGRQQLDKPDSAARRADLSTSSDQPGAAAVPAVVRRVAAVAADAVAAEVDVAAAGGGRRSEMAILKSWPWKTACGTRRMVSTTMSFDFPTVVRCD